MKKKWGLIPKGEASIKAADIQHPGGYPPHCPLVEVLLGAGLEPSAPAGGWTLSARL